MSDPLVKVASYWHLWEADLACSRLALEGIVTCLGNAGFLSWYWHYGNACGGVKVYVLASDAEQARAILSRVSPRDNGEQPPWVCPRCGERLKASWQVCWSCGGPEDRGEPPTIAREEAPAKPPEGPMEPEFAALAALVAVMLFVATGDLLVASFAWLAIVVFLWHIQRLRLEKVHEVTPEEAREVRVEPPRTGPEESIDRRRCMGEAIAWRAWKASVLGAFWCPVLLVYSIWLLWRLDPEKTPLGPAGRRRRTAAMVLSAVAALVFFGLVPVLWAVAAW